MGSTDPIGVYPDVVDVNGGTGTASVDVTILAYWNPAGAGSGGDGGGGDGGGGGGGDGGGGDGGGGDGGGGDGGGGDVDPGSGGNGNGTTTISGDIIITEAYAAGEAAALTTLGGVGPVDDMIDIIQPEPSGGGAEGPYEITISAGYTELELIGIWDSNYNWVFDADDLAGPYISEVGVDGNPVDVSGDENLPDHDIQIPLGSYQIDLVPFVSLSGTVTHIDGAFSGQMVTVAAFKYKPDGEVDADDLEDETYDFMRFDTSGGETSLSYSLDVPADTVVYLFAVDDEDGDDLLNEPEEAIGSGSLHEYGRLPTGSSSQAIDIVLKPFEDH